MKIVTLPWKKSPPSFPATPSKSWGPVKPPFLKISLEVQPSRKGVGAHYWMFISIIHSYHIPLPKRKKEFFAMQKSLRVLKLLKVLLGFSSSFTMTGSSLGFSVIFSKRTSHLKISSEKIKQYLHDTSTKYYIENICHQFPDLLIYKLPILLNI